MAGPRKQNHSQYRVVPLALTMLANGLLSSCAKSPILSPEELAEANAVFESCLVCHSTREMQRGPIIDGLPAWYTSQQLRKFQQGIRGQNPANKSEQLMGSARDRFPDDRTIWLLARYIESLPPKPYQPVVRGDAESGATLYQSCIPCHGEKGEGNEILKSPPLDFLEDWYLLDQLRKFASGKRGYHPSDIEGIQMAYTLVNLDDKSFKDIVAHIQGFSITQ